MTSAMTVFEKAEFGKVRVIVKDGKPWFVAKDVAEALGYKDTSYAINAHCKGVGEIQTPTKGGLQTVKIINEYDVYRLVMRSQLSSAEKFQDWVVEEVLPSIRKTGKYSIEPETEIPEIPVTDSAKISLMVLESAFVSMRMADVSKIACYKKLCETYKVPSSYLPQTVSRPVQILSATELLKRTKAGISAKVFNTKMVDAGFLEIQTRPSTSQGSRDFKALTPAGLKYGENLANPEYPLETRPMYYTETFRELLNILSNSQECN